MIYQNKIEIIPAVLPKSFAELAETLERLRGVAPRVQIDVVADIFQGRESLPCWEDFDFEFDLFIEPGSFVDRALGLGASSIVVHARHTTSAQALARLQPMRTGGYPVVVGLGLRAKDTPEVVEQHQGLFDFVEVMGIDNEGHQGEPFDPQAIKLVRTLRERYPELVIQVDGHVFGHEGELIAAGANRLAVGSAIMNAEDPRRAYKDLLSRVN